MVSQRFHSEATAGLFAVAGEEVVRLVQIGLEPQLDSAVVLEARIVSSGMV